jgi:ubiquinone/menaquinone biosynthesis C-methylase UbiE
MNAETRFRTYLRMLEDLGSAVRPDSVFLDFGCGAGNVVAAGRELGYSMFGCDIAFKDGKHTAALAADGAIRLIPTETYRLPFDDASVDILVSDQVFEHVMDYPACLAEIQRVLKPGAAFLHIFPSRYIPIEPHVFVPLATIVRSRLWLLLWAALGVRKPSQRGLTSADTVVTNLEYLTHHTNYLNKKQIRNHFAKFFQKVHFAERVFLKHSERAKILYKLSPLMPFLPAAYSCARSRVVYGIR